MAEFAVPEGTFKSRQELRTPDMPSQMPYRVFRNKAELLMHDRESHGRDNVALPSMVALLFYFFECLYHIYHEANKIFLHVAWQRAEHVSQRIQFNTKRITACSEQIGDGTVQGICDISQPLEARSDHPLFYPGKRVVPHFQLLSQSSLGHPNLSSSVAYIRSDNRSHCLNYPTIHNVRSFFKLKTYVAFAA